MIHTGPLGYFFSFILVAGKLSGLEEVDNVPCPSWSLGLGNKDQWHLLIRGGTFLDRGD